MLGRLGADPEIKTGADGQKIAIFSIAMGETIKDKVSGEKKKITDWANVVVFSERLTEVVEKYCKKGSRVYIEGKFRTRKWTSKGGENHYSTEVVLGPFNSALQLVDSKPNGEFKARGRSEDEYGTDSAEEIPF
jgi:single-strand DNA-binding protein